MSKPTEKSLIEFEIDGGNMIIFEGVNDQKPDDLNFVALNDNADPTPAQKTLRQAIDTAKSAAELVFNSFKEMNSPDEINLEFGIKMAAKSGVIIASAETEANFKISLKWKKTGS
jgi:hypothetical protein